MQSSLIMQEMSQTTDDSIFAGDAEDILSLHVAWVVPSIPPSDKQSGHNMHLPHYGETVNAASALGLLWDCPDGTTRSLCSRPMCICTRCYTRV